MEQLYTGKEIAEITIEYNVLRSRGYSKNRALETLARKYYCHKNTIANYVNAWG